MMHVIGFSVLCTVGSHMVYSAWSDWIELRSVLDDGFDFELAACGIWLVALAIGGV